VLRGSKRILLRHRKRHVRIAVRFDESIGELADSPVCISWPLKNARTLKRRRWRRALLLPLVPLLVSLRVSLIVLLLSTMVRLALLLVRMPLLMLMWSVPAMARAAMRR
jgi:hypothetical protein